VKNTHVRKSSLWFFSLATYHIVKDREGGDAIAKKKEKRVGTVNTTLNNNEYMNIM
jgi:hypothetical protein